MDKINIKVPTLVAFTSILLIYFQVYWHYWLVKLLGSYVINTMLPILILFMMLVGREFIAHDIKKAKNRKISRLLFFLFCYISFSTVSIFLNEQGSLAEIKSYLIYIYSPILICLSIYGLYIFRKNKKIKSILRILLWFGIIFSIYVTIVYSIYPSKLSDMIFLETNRGEIHGDTGASFVLGDIGGNRYTIPGISSTTYGGMLVPLIFIALYFRKNSSGRSKFGYSVVTIFLTFLVFKTISRGPLIALTVGIIYLICWKWFKRNEVVLASFFLIISVYTFARVVLLRLLITTFEIFSIKSTYLVSDMQYLVFHDPRIMSIKSTLSYIYQRPFFGIGMSNLIYEQQLLFGKEHNNYLSIAASYGILSFAFYILFLILLFITVSKSIKKADNNVSMRDMGITLGAGLLSLIIYLNFAPAEFHFIWIWFGLTVAWLRNCENKSI